MAELATRRSALEEARVRLNSSLAEAEGIKADAEKALAEAGDESEANRRSEGERTALATAREKLEQARLKLGNFENAARMRTARLGQINAESQNWQRRRDGAAAQLETLDARRGSCDAARNCQRHAGWLRGPARETRRRDRHGSGRASRGYG
jgi:chromosome segregation protein